MIDPKDLKTRYDEIKQNIENRYMDIDLEQIAKDADERGAILAEVEALRSERNDTASKIGRAHV